METERFSETLVSTYESTGCHDTEEKPPTVFISGFDQYREWKPYMEYSFLYLLKFVFEMEMKQANDTLLYCVLCCNI
jgi:hypothetical protein